MLPATHTPPTHTTTTTTYVFTAVFLPTTRPSFPRPSPPPLRPPSAHRRQPSIVNESTSSPPPLVSMDSAPLVSLGKRDVTSRPARHRCAHTCDTTGPKERLRGRRVLFFFQRHVQGPSGTNHRPCRPIIQPALFLCLLPRKLYTLVSIRADGP
jgi:hypothetical protein